MNRLLDNLTVLDLTRLLPGPVCSCIMADYGAEVIKIEDPWQGDPTRHNHPKLDEDSSFFWQLNRNKKSLAINLKDPQGIEILTNLAKTCDVLMEGFRPGVMARLGLDYSSLQRHNPQLIYLSLTGYGQDGPYAQKAGHDINYISLMGIQDLSSPPGEPPVMPCLQVADIGGGSILALSSIMMALYYREKHGKGQNIDLSMADGLLPWLSYAASSYWGGEKLPRRNEGVLTGAFACYNLYPTADKKYMSLGALEPAFWKNFCEAINRSHWIEKQYQTEEQESMKTELKEMFMQKTQQEWNEFFSSLDACCEPVLSLEEAYQHPHSQYRNNFVKVERNNGISQKQLGFPLKFSSDEGKISLPPPKLGEHSRKILVKAGYKEEDIDKFSQEGIIKHQ